MKKIISALALGAIVAGSAFADLKVSLSYRNGAELLKYVNTGANGRTTDDYGNVYIDSGYDKSGSTTTVGNLTGWNSGKDNMTLRVTGDIFDIKATLQPTIGSNNINWHIFDATAKIGNFTAEAGWNGDGIMGFQVKKAADDGNEEGKTFGTYKLGSIFTSSDGIAANNKVSFSTAKNYFALAGYNIPVNSDISVNLQASVMFDRAWDSTQEQNNGNIGWGIFIDPEIFEVVDAELFVKGIRVGKAGSDKVSEFVTGAYFRLNFLPAVVSDNTVGGSAVIKDGNLMEYNADWRFYLFPLEKFYVTYYGKFAKLVSNDDTGYAPCDGADVGALAGLSNAFKSSQALWNMLSVRYKVNSTLTTVFTAGELTDLDTGFNSGRESADGTQVFAYPHVQLYANKSATISAGAVVAFGGIGANKDANKDIDILVNVPVLFRVKM